MHTPDTADASFACAASAPAPDHHDMGTAPGFGLAHAQAPRGVERVLGVTRHHPVECEYRICSPEDSGLPLEELRLRLSGVPGSDTAQTFVHPYFEGDEQTAEGCLSPLFSEDMATPDFASIPHGLKPGPHHAEYLLVAQNEAGLPAGYIHFTLSLVTDIADEQQCDGSPVEAGLVMTLKRIFVVQQERSVGIATALLEKAGFVFWSELRDLAGQTRARVAGLEDGIILHPFVMSSWHSRAGKMAHYRLVDLVCQYRDAANHDFEDELFTVSEVREHGRY